MATRSLILTIDRRLFPFGLTNWSCQVCHQVSIEGQARVSDAVRHLRRSSKYTLCSFTIAQNIPMKRVRMTTSIAVPLINPVISHQTQHDSREIVPTPTDSPRRIHLEVWSPICVLGPFSVLPLSVILEDIFDGQPLSPAYMGSHMGLTMRQPYSINRLDFWTCKELSTEGCSDGVRLVPDASLPSSRRRELSF